MNAKTASLLVAGCGLIFVVLMMRQVDQESAPDDLQQFASALGSEQAQVTRVQTQGSDEDPAWHQFEMAMRLQQLEQTVRQLQQASVPGELSTRVAELERIVRRLDQGNRTKPSSSRFPGNEITQLKRDHTSLRRAHDQLASKVSKNKSADVPFKSDLRIVQQKVFSLELAVQRLENRR